MQYFGRTGNKRKVERGLRLVSNQASALTDRQLQLLAKRNAAGPGAGAPVGGGAGVGGGALRRVLLRLAAGVAGGALRLEHLPPEVLPAQQRARDLLVAARKVGLY